MSAVQERNAELVDLLTPDFLRRGEVSSDVITLGGLNVIGRGATNNASINASGAIQANTYTRLDNDGNANNQGVYVNAQWNVDGSPGTYNFINTGAFGGKASRAGMTPGGSWTFDVATGATNPLTWTTVATITNNGGISLTASSTIIDTVVGGNVSLQIRNSDNTNAASTASLLIQQGGAGGGDVYVQWTEGGVISWLGGYDISAGGFGINTSSLPGATARIWLPNAGGLVFNGNTQVVNAFGCNSKAPQGAFASGGAVAPGAGAFGASSAANFAALVTLVSNIRTALVNNGIMS
jgi:hypothetical protein